MSNNNINRSFYNKFWKHTKIADPKTWTHWNIVKHFEGRRCLEIGPGTRPKIPIKNNYFLDISSTAVYALRQAGGMAKVADTGKKLPFNANYFDLVCAFEVLEHVPNDRLLLNEIARVLKPNGTLIVSFPLHSRLFNSYDDLVGHFRRYDIDGIENFFDSTGLRINKYSAISIPWFGKRSAKVAVFLVNKFSRIVFYLQDLFDSTKFSPLRKPIRLMSWENNSYKSLINETTGIFVVKKKQTKHSNRL